MRSTSTIRNPVTRRMGSPIISPRVEIFGDWAKTERVLSTIDKVIGAGALAGQKSAAEKMKKIAKRFIRTNGGSIGWAPLKPKYRKYKEAKGFSGSNLYVMTGLYRRSIMVWRNGLTYYVGLKGNTRHSRKGGSPTLAFIARVLESGSTARNIAARPLWSPTFKELGGNAAIKGLMLWHIRDHIYKAYKVRAKVSII